MITKSHPSSQKLYNQHALQLLHKHTYPDDRYCPEQFFGAFPTPSMVAVTVPGDEIECDNSSKRKFNYCLHSKDTFEMHSNCITSYLVHCTHSRFTYGAAFHLKGGCWFTPSRPVEPTLPEVTQQMRARAWQELLPKLESGFSLLNFLWELKDLPSLFKQALKASRFIKNSDIIKILKKGNTKTASELLLAYSFAIAPFMADVESICDLLAACDKEVNKFIAEGKKAQSYHYREDLGSSTTSAGGSYDRFLETETSAEYYATLRCKYLYKKPDVWVSLMRLWGLRVTPEALWNAVPFSFVVDWVLKIGDALQQFDRDCNLTVEVLDYCDTIKSKVVKREVAGGGSSCGDWRTAPAIPWFVHSHPGIVVWEWTRSIYNRVPTLPETGYYFPVLDALSMRELVLSAALLRTN